jgi:hypothetical protein
MDVRFYLLFLSLAVLCLSLHALRIAIKSKDWRKTNAVVVDRYYLASDRNPGKGTPRIVYSYSVQSIQCTSEILAFDSFCISKHSPQKLFEKYPIGKSIFCYYDPDCPKRAVIERRAKGGIFFLILLSAMFLVIITLSYM